MDVPTLSKQLKEVVEKAQKSINAVELLLKQLRQAWSMDNPRSHTGTGTSFEEWILNGKHIERDEVWKAMEIIHGSKFLGLKHTRQMHIHKIGQSLGIGVNELYFWIGPVILMSSRNIFQLVEMGDLSDLFRSLKDARRDRIKDKSSKKTKQADIFIVSDVDDALKKI